MASWREQVPHLQDRKVLLHHHQLQLSSHGARMRLQSVWGGRQHVWAAMFHGVTCALMCHALWFAIFHEATCACFDVPCMVMPPVHNSAEDAARWGSPKPCVVRLRNGLIPQGFSFAARQASRPRSLTDSCR